MIRMAEINSTGEYCRGFVGSTTIGNLLDGRLPMSLLLRATNEWANVAISATVQWF